MKKKLDSENQSIKKAFKPTALMEKFVQTAVRTGSDNVAGIVRETRMSESQYYEWKKIPGFMDWMNEYAKALLRGDAWKLNAIGMRNAKRDHRYWESMQKIVGNITEQGSQTNVQFNMGVSFIDDTGQTTQEPDGGGEERK